MKKISTKVKKIISMSIKQAKLYEDWEVRVEHLMVAIINDYDNVAIKVLIEMGIDVDVVHKKIENSISKLNSGSEDYDISLPLNIITENVIKGAEKECDILNNEYLDTQHILLSLLKTKNEINNILKSMKVTYKKYDKELKIYTIKNSIEPMDSDEGENFKNYKKQIKGKGKSNETPILDNFSVDLTKRAVEGKIDPVIGRDDIIQRVAQILARKKKNNPILIGEPGVGKTTIAEGLALKIVQGEAPRTLLNKRIVSLDLASLVAGTKYRGQFEERIKGIVDELVSVDNVILFIDEVHTMVGAGNASGSMDAANVLKPALGRGDLQLVGATTLDEYRENIEKDGALARRFQQVIINPPSVEDTIKILNKIKFSYENFHKVNYPIETIEKCVKLADRYITDREFPDKAIDIMDEVGSRSQVNSKPPKKISELECEIIDIKEEKNDVVKSQKYEEAARLRDTERIISEKLESEKRKWLTTLDKKRKTITPEDVNEVVSIMTGIPLNRLTGDQGRRLLEMEKDLHGSIIGQDEALLKIAQSLRRNRVGIRNPKKPIGSFMFLGPTGVGKCHGKGTKVLMYDGSIKNVEDILVGELLMGDDSTPRTVLSLARGKDQMYEITPKKGGDTFTCNESHILSLKNTTTKKIINISIKEYLEKSKWFKHTHKLYSVGVDFTKKDIKIDPYFLGLWLGDGISKRVGVTTADKEIVDYIESFVNKLNTKKVLVSDLDDEITEEYSVSIHLHENNKSNTYYVSTGMKGGQSCLLRKDFKHYNLLDNKHIPFDYLTSGVEDRKMLLSGIIDSDGYMYHKCYEIVQKNKKLSDDIVYLSRSLGYCTSIKEKFVDGELYYRIYISGDLSDLPLLLERKKSQKRKQKKDVLVTGFKIEALKIDDYFGFTLDGNHLYLLGDFTVTHNTHLTKKLAQYMFGDEDSLIRFDMSEFQEKHSISRLIGSPPGYVGHEEGGQLTEKVRRKPYSIILFDEIEKANKDIYNVLLQLLDDGQLTDSLGRKVNFKNCMVIMTSNIGVKKLQDFGTGVGFGTKSKLERENIGKEDLLRDELKKHFAPEFLNRLDDVIIFKSLTKDEIGQIVDLEIINLRDRVEEIGYNLQINKTVRDYLIEIGYDEDYGARPLNRAIQTYVEDPVSEEILKGKVKEGQTIKVSYVKTKEKIVIKVE